MRLALSFALTLVLVLVASVAPAEQAPNGAPDVPQIPDKLPDASAFEGKTVVAVKAKMEGLLWNKAPVLGAPKVGDKFVLAEARAELSKLLAGGGFSTGTLEVDAVPGGVQVLFRLTPARLVRRVLFRGNPLTDDELRRAAGLSDLRDVTERSMESIQQKVRAYLVQRGYPATRVDVSAIETDLPLVVVVEVQIDPGAALVVDRRVFAGLPTWDADAVAAAKKYAVNAGDRVDEEALDAADRALSNALRGNGFPQAAVTHSTSPAGDDRVVLTVSVVSGAKILPSFEGNLVFDRDGLLEVLDLKGEADRSPQRLAAKIETAYRRRGFLDARVEVELLGKPQDERRTMRFRIHEGDPVVVEKRIYPCLGGALTAERLDEEIDSYLEEDLSTEGFGDAGQKNLDKTLGPNGDVATGARPKPQITGARQIFFADTYDRAVDHLRELFRAEGYMFAEIGDAALLRGSCAKGSQPGALGCKVVPPPPLDQAKLCQFDVNRLPLPFTPIDKKAACVPDPQHGVECAKALTVVIPVNPGPRSVLWDVAFEGTKAIAPATLMKKAAGPILRLGEPLSLRDAEAARSAVLGYYKDEGYAFATVRSTFEYSPDKSHARVRFVVTEGEQVIIDKIFVEGNKRTLESVVRARLSIKEGGVFRARLARESQDRLAQLGVFQSVSIAMVNPTIPAKRKSVQVTVVERVPQHLDFLGGYSTGEGLRFGFEYGYGNLAGYALDVTLRARFSYQPFIGCTGSETGGCSSAFYDATVVKRWTEQAHGLDRVPRKIGLAFNAPHTPLGPATRATLELIHLLDLRRDYILTRYSPVLTVTYNPWRPLTLTYGADLELNNFFIFDNLGYNDLLSSSPSAPQIAFLHLPQGNTAVAAANVSVLFDFRDNKLGATSGWFSSLTTEYVQSLFNDKLDPKTQPRQEFLHLLASGGYYKKLTFLPKSPVLAFELRGGLNQDVGYCYGKGAKPTDGNNAPICDSYPDRLFYLGGFESTRGFFPQQMLPQDSIDSLKVNPAARLSAIPCSAYPRDPSGAPMNVSAAGLRGAAACDTDLSINAPRGGDVFINPRIELRVPAFSWGGFVVFVDAANAWRYKVNFQPWRLRYAVGPGLSIDTPVGPVALDLGFNVSRYTEFGEPLAVFSFSIGRF